MKRYAILLLVIATFVAHAVEEYATNFHQVDASILWLAGLLNTNPLYAWIGIQVAVLTLILALYLYFPRMLRGVLLALFVVELSHLALAFTHGAYYPGLVTSLLFLPLAWVVYKNA